MRIMEAPEGGILWWCASCGKALDTIELLAEVKYGGKIDKAISGIANLPDVKLDIAITQQSVDRYTNSYLARRTNHNLWLADTRERWLRGKECQSFVTEKVGIAIPSLESQYDVMNGVGRWFHPTTLVEMSKLLNDGVRLNVPVELFRTCVAVPWWKSYGRLGALLLFGEPHNAVQMWYCDSQRVDAGAMFLDALPPEPERVIAVSSPFLAMRIQHQHYCERRTAAPVVAVHESTNPALWEQLGAREVIFYSNTISAPLIRHGIRTAGSKIAYVANAAVSDAANTFGMEPLAAWKRFAESVDPKLTADDFMASIVSRAVDPIDECRKYLLKCDMSQIQTAVDYFSVTKRQMEQLLDGCSSPKERNKLETTLAPATRTTVAHLTNCDVLQKVDDRGARWISRRNGHRAEISNVTVTLESGQMNKAGAVTYAAAVRYKDKSATTTLTDEQLNGSIVNAVSSFAVRQFGEAPEITCSDVMFRNLIWKFSGTVKVRQMPDYVGWSPEDNCYKFPQFDIRGGDVIPVANSFDSVISMPMNVPAPEMPDKEYLLSCLEPTPQNAIKWAFIAAVADNMLAQAAGNYARGIALVGYTATALGRRLVEEANLLSTAVPSTTEASISIAATQYFRGVPMLIRAEDDASLNAAATKWLFGSSHWHTIMPMNKSRAALAASLGDWIVVGKENAATEAYGPLLGILTWGLAYAHRAGAIGSDTESTLTTFMKWAEEVIGQPAGEVPDQAAHFFIDYPPMQQHRKFIRAIGLMIKCGYLSVVTGKAAPKARKHAPVYFDKRGGMVHVVKSKVMDAMKSMGAKEFDLSLVQDGFDRYNTGVQDGDEVGSILSIPIKYWTNELYRWGVGKVDSSV